MATTLHRSAFVKALRSELPDIEPWLKGYRDNLTLEMTRVRDYVEDAIQRADYQRVARCFRVIDRAFVLGNEHVRNSIVVTFLEHLHFGTPPDLRAEASLPRRLVAARAYALKGLRDLTTHCAPKSKKSGRLTSACK